VSGDTAVVKVTSDGLLLAVIDVLGHGQEAHETAKTAKAFLDERLTEDITKTLTSLHDALKGSRGAAGSIAALHLASQRVLCIGIGNTVVRIIGDKQQQAVTVDGVLGQSIRTPREEILDLGNDDVLVLHTDGVRTGVKLEDYPQMRYQRAQAIANTFIRRYARPYDDATCIVVRRRR
jgi:serine/threonine protein phosphatase PrpC